MGHFFPTNTTCFGLVAHLSANTGDSQIRTRHELGLLLRFWRLVDVGYERRRSVLFTHQFEERTVIFHEGLACWITLQCRDSVLNRINAVVKHQSREGPNNSPIANPSKMALFCCWTCWFCCWTCC